MDPREIEPVYNYNFTTGAEDDDLTIELPGYFKGDAKVREFHYYGGDHAVYIRNKHQCILCDHIHEGIRGLLSDSHDIFVSEIDSKKEYLARIVHDNIDAIAEEALKLHDYRFPYHPFPQLDQTLSTGDETCILCGKKKGIYYIDLCEDHFDPDKRRRILCPRCIMDDPVETSDIFREVGGEYRNFGGKKEVFYGNLPFYDDGKPCSFWAVHCNEPAIYLGQLEREDLNPMLEKEIRSTFDRILNTFEGLGADETLSWYKKGGLRAHLFKCSVCGRILGAFS
ncbi:MAG: CbrC family protein [Lachnospiraceae bacterium]|nr:CbrC family protein [Lachnospiraceae bacterium]